MKKKNLLKTNVDLHTRMKDPTKTEPLSVCQTHRSRALYTPPSKTRCQFFPSNAGRPGVASSAVGRHGYENNKGTKKKLNK